MQQQTSLFGTPVRRPRLASTFASGSNVLRSATPLSDDQIHRVAPSIFAEDAHDSRSARYTYIPTIEVLDALRKEGFDPFMVCQTRVRDESHREHTKHMIRLRHASQITAQEANEIVLLNSHNGTSSFQMMAGVFRFVCQNGMVCGDSLSDIRVPHKGDVVGRVIEGAYSVLDAFEDATEQREEMKVITLSPQEQEVFARAAMVLKYDEDLSAAPVTAAQLLTARRSDDRPNDLWTTLNRVQENMIKGGLSGRTKTGKRTTTRPVAGIDQNVKLNRALWSLAEGMKALKA